MKNNYIKFSSRKIQETSWFSSCELCGRSIELGQEIVDGWRIERHGAYAVKSLVRLHANCVHGRKVSNEEASSFFKNISQGVDNGAAKKGRIGSL
ncbi:MAG: hypothetical protein ACPGJV_02630 [Bacteriovoracaceae bacterium]